MLGHRLLCGRRNPALAPVALSWFLAGCASTAVIDPPVVEGRVSEGETQPPFDAGPAPQARLWPRRGELSVYLLDLSIGTLVPRHGEAAVIVGPRGDIALLDVGARRHHQEVARLVYQLNTEHLTPANGYGVREPMQVEWVVLTHYHGDHIASLPALVDDDGLVITRGIVHRGFVEVGSGANTNHGETVCELLGRPSFSDLDTPICRAGETVSCAQVSAGDPVAAADCDALPLALDLSDDASLLVLAANGYIYDGREIQAPPPMPTDQNNEENARSLVALLSHGAFRMHFGGDLSGEGTPGVPDVESRLATHAAPYYEGVGVDVAVAHHHARRTSSNEALVELLAPRDGRQRHVVAGMNPVYLNSPHAEVLHAWLDGDRLRGGRFWIPRLPPAGATHDHLIVADGDLIVQTVQGGEGYWVQADGPSPQAMASPSIRRDTR
ncbi:MAG: MBL fold metallo-hydrolase [Deltaproteobacteria bacterium]|nr:MAG: MBL fold metallo-hydrolase [Deltaproteobacteria bacterium]